MLFDKLCNRRFLWNVEADILKTNLKQNLRNFDPAYLLSNLNLLSYVNGWYLKLDYIISYRELLMWKPYLRLPNLKFWTSLSTNWNFVKLRKRIITEARSKHLKDKNCFTSILTYRYCLTKFIMDLRNIIRWSKASELYKQNIVSFDVVDVSYGMSIMASNWTIRPITEQIKQCKKLKWCQTAFSNDYSLIKTLLLGWARARRAKSQRGTCSRWPESSRRSGSTICSRSSTRTRSKTFKTLSTRCSVKDSREPSSFARLPNRVLIFARLPNDTELRLFVISYVLNELGFRFEHLFHYSNELHSN